MKFNSKNQNYHSPQANRGVFINPFVKYIGADIATETEHLKIHFALQYLDQGEVQTLENMFLQFNELGIDTLIDDENGNSVEIMSFLMAGGIYDAEKVTRWGDPTFLKVQGFFDLPTVWGDLTFKEQPFKQLAIDWTVRKILVEGVPLINHFELEIP